MTYPRVMGERTTLEAAINGRSIARFGDGELRIACGGRAISQMPDKTLAKAFRQILKSPPKGCLICAPNLESETPEMWFWHKYLQPGYKALFNIGYEYGSTWITRPDCAPWINTDEYWDRLKALWRGRVVILVRGDDKSLTKELMPEALNIALVNGPRQHAFSDIDRIEKEVLQHVRFWRDSRVEPIVLMCLGATATLLAVRLGNKGVHAVDLGHVGMFMRRRQNGEPLVQKKKAQQDGNISRQDRVA